MGKGLAGPGIFAVAAANKGRWMAINARKMCGAFEIGAQRFVGAGVILP
jgi:hypothetical protein